MKFLAAVCSLAVLLVIFSEKLSAILPPGEAASAYSGTLIYQSDRRGNWDIFLIQADGEGRRRLTRDAADDKQPVWSPRGDRIAFMSERTGGGDIYVMDADGWNLRRLTDHTAEVAAPSWCPDGKWIAFEGGRDGRSEVYRVAAAARKVEHLTDTSSRKLGPAFSPDGKALAYMDRAMVRWQIALFDLERGSSRILSRGWGNCRPAFSPDGRLLAFVSTRDTEKADIRLRDMARETDWKLTTRPDAHNYDPSFSPDGLSLALASTIERRPEQWDLFLVNINGQNLVQLTSGRANERFPDWRPEWEGR